MAPFAALLAIFAVALAGGLVLRAGAATVAASPSTAGQRVPVLGGEEPPTHAWSRFHARWYPMALLFLAFDMEMVFMYPWAVVFLEEGALALIEMLMFIVILRLGILYPWRERALEWS